MRSVATRTRQRTTSTDSQVEPVLRGPSQPLDARTRAAMEPQFGHDFSRVRVHADPAAAESAESLGARAYTVGEHLVFGPGQYQPNSANGQRLLAHELTHVMQQNAAGPMVQRDDKTKDKPKIKRAAASTSPELVVKESAPDKAAPCACLVFMHHSEVNARKAAEAMYAECRYNLAIVSPRAGREIDIPNVGSTDPNELFPRHIFRECHAEDAPCQSFIDDEDNKKSTDKQITQEYVQRQFFLAIKKCSKKFTLPIVGLHTNVVSDTAAYRDQLGATPKALESKRKALGKPRLSAARRTKLEGEIAELETRQQDLDSIRGKAFKDKSPEGDALPYATLELWLKRNFPTLVRDRKADAKDEKRRKTWKKSIESPSGGLLAGGMTNIFKWCQAHDNSECYVGDPSRPDNVVWVTRKADFDDLRKAKPDANIALQTRVTPGESETDLSSMFVGDLLNDAQDRLRREPVPTRDAMDRFTDDVRMACRHATPARDPGLVELQEFLRRWERAQKEEKDVVAAREAVRYVNVETPQATASKAETLEGYRDVKSILEPLKLFCCDDTAHQKIEKNLGPKT